MIGFSVVFQIWRKISQLYCADDGRPALELVLLFKLLLLGYPFCNRTERQFKCAVQINVAYRRFLGLGLTTRFPMC